VFLSILTSSEFLAAILGALVGSLSSGVISYCLQKQAISHAAADREKAKVAEEQSLARSLLIKLMRIHTGFRGLRLHFSECDSAGKRENPPLERWQSFIPLANLPEMVHFSPEETGLLLKIRADDLFNTIVNLDVIHNAVLEPMRTAATLKAEIGRAIGVESMVGNLATSAFDKKTLLLIQPQVVQLQSLLEQMSSECAKSELETQKALEDFVKTSNEHLNTALRIAPIPQNKKAKLE
jgi:hypothetical protein